MKNELDLYQIKVTLKGSKPPVWRRFNIVSDVSLQDLHWVLQAVLGWEDYHLHEFRAAKKFFGEVTPDSDEYTIEESEVALSSVLTRVKQKLTYIYDFGDDWQHEIVLEKKVPYAPGAPLVKCLAGERACPPEDCGGLWGFDHYLEAISDPNHPDHNEMLDWLEDYDPDAFDLDEINRILEEMTEPKPPRKRKKPVKPRPAHSRHFGSVRSAYTGGTRHGAQEDLRRIGDPLSALLPIQSTTPCQPRSRTSERGHCEETVRIA